MLIVLEQFLPNVLLPAQLDCYITGWLDFYRTANVAVYIIESVRRLCMCTSQAEELGLLYNLQYLATTFLYGRLEMKSF